MHLTELEESKKRDLTAILIILLCYLCFSGSDATVKYLTQYHSTVPILFLNSSFVLFFVGLYGIFKSGPAYFKTEKLKLHLIRGCLGCFFGLLIVYSLGNTSLAGFYMMIFTAPLWVVVFSLILMKEKLDSFRSLVVFLGFVVILYVFMPEGRLSLDLGLLAALAGGVGIGFNMIFIRKYLREERPMLISGLNHMVVFCLLAPFALPLMSVDILKSIPFFVLSGGLILLASVSMARAFQIASHSAILAPFHYSQMVYGVIIGYLVFTEMPSGRIITGSIALTVLGCGLFWYDYMNNRKLRRYVRYDAKP